MFEGLIANGSPYATDMMQGMFGNTGSLATSCPTGTSQVTTGYESYWNSHVACAPNTISITWQKEDGTTLTTNSCTYGDAITIPEAPHKTGHRFTGWTVVSQ